MPRQRITVNILCRKRLVPVVELRIRTGKEVNNSTGAIWLCGRGGFVGRTNSPFAREFRRVGFAVCPLWVWACGFRRIVDSPVGSRLSPGCVALFVGLKGI